jgi:S1-C subfamily serine protease
MTGDSSAPPPDEDRRRPSRRSSIRSLAVGILAALVVVGGFLVLRPSGSDDSATNATPTTTTTTAPAFEGADVYAAILPSLVMVSTESATSIGIGSGVIVNAEGQILTAHHVVDGATSIMVTFSDGTESPAHIVSADPANDIAVLASDIPPQVIVPAVLGSSSGLRIGDEAYPAGNPLGFAGTFTAGVISGLNRTIQFEDGSGSLEGLIQFDGAVNPGSSGGPLVNRLGQVIGIVTALANPTDQTFFIGIGFAIPISTASGAAGGPAQ